ncbi:hypothetical protein PPROV_000009900 [Pycnococcus provasolii]|uniref:Uncharacterized protein n=1 Tax=Pycnococcus provasolii TaxID=41880 RepID=A0A830H507_9CHLO|nr:hypothetical protein PPROV_000009900 [Pycnococcus provasolii]
MASSSSQIQTVTSLTSSLSLLHDYAASAYTSALTRLVELEHEHEETARSITWLTASLAEDKDVFKTKVPPQLARAIVDYRTARRAQQDASTRGLAPPGGGGGGGGGAPPSPGNFAAQCRLAHAILCGECGVGAGGRGTTRTPLQITTTTS